MKFFLKLLLPICTAWAAAGCGGDDAPDEQAALSSMRFAQASYDLTEGESATPVLYLRPAGGTETAFDAGRNLFEVTFVVADPTVASISASGVVTGLKKGTTTLTARSPYCATAASAQIVVREGVEILKIESVRFAEQQYAVTAGKSVQPELFVKIKGEASEFRYDAVKNPYSLVWSSSDTSVATVSADGTVTALSPGKITLTVRTPYFEQVVSVPVTVLLASMRFEQTEYTVPLTTCQPRLMIRVTEDGEETAYDSAANPYDVTFTVGDPTVASVSAAGVVTRLKMGATTLTASTDLFGQPVTTSIRFLSTDATNWVGEWVLSSWTGDPSLAGKIYLELKQENTFDMYQNVNAPGFAKFTGTYSVTGEAGAQVIAGTYSDGKSWGDSYTFTATDEKLTLTGRTTGYVSVYDRTTIPDYVKEGATIRTTRSAFTPFL